MVTGRPFAHAGGLLVVVAVVVSVKVTFDGDKSAHIAFFCEVCGEVADLTGGIAIFDGCFSSITNKAT